MTSTHRVRAETTPTTAAADNRDVPRHPARVTAMVLVLAATAGAASLGGLLLGGGPGRHLATTARGAEITLYGEGLYSADTLLVGAGNRGQDVVILAFEIAALLTALVWHHRGRIVGTVALGGVLSFFTYYYVSMTFAAAQNPMFPLYVLALTASVGALVRVLIAAVPRAADLPLFERPGRRALVAYLSAVALALTAAWLPGMVAVSLDGGVEEHVGPYTSAVTEALDLGFVVPVVVLAAVQLQRGRPLGRLLTLLMLVLNVCIGVLLMGQGFAQIVLDVPLTTTEVVGKMATFAVLTFVAGGLLVRMAVHARRQPGPHTEGRAP